jgi:hypothetical protein
MNQHLRPLTPEKLLERVLRVADLLTVPAEPTHTEQEHPSNPPNSITLAEEKVADGTAKSVKRHFRVK